MTLLDFKLRLMDNGTVKLAAFLDVSDSSIRNWKEGRALPRVDVAMKISEFIGVPVTDLFDEVDETGKKVEPEIAHAQ